MQKTNKPKQVIVVRMDVGMGPGKIASQVAHASMGVFFVRGRTFWQFMWMRLTKAMMQWKNGEFTKIVLEAKNEAELLRVYEEAKAAGLPCSLIQDNGHTVFNGVPTYTTVAIGPDYPSKIDPITRKLRLMK